MRNGFMIPMLMLATVGLAAGVGKKVYRPEADAKADIQKAVATADDSGKHVLLVIGGNWCAWCMKLDKLFEQNVEVSQALKADYEVVHVNYSEENKNEALLAELGYPQRFGFPVLLVLDGKGRVLHTEDSAAFEEGKGHSPKKLLTFLKNWNRAALDPATYK